MKKGFFFTIFIMLYLFFVSCNSVTSENKNGVKKETKTGLPIVKKKIDGKQSQISKQVLLNSREAKKKPIYKFGKINGIQFDKMLKQKEAVQIKGNKLEFSNAWAYDALSKADGKGAMIKIDNQYYKINYGKKRGDVRKRSKSNNVLNCGITGSIDISDLKPGKHRLSICLLGTSKQYYLESPYSEIITKK